jgi:hypothetical protein
MLASNLNSMGTNINGGEYVLFAVASAVIGGTARSAGGQDDPRAAWRPGHRGDLQRPGLIGLSSAATFIVTRSSCWSR